MALSDIRPSKKMGQNFLINPVIANQIVNFINFNDCDCVVEIGPGKGAMTEHIVQKTNNLIVVELDKRLAEHIKSKFPSINTINDDVLNFDLSKALKRYHNPILISNLPYSISSPMITKYLMLDRPIKFICMLQKEFVGRLLAKPSTKQYNAFSVVAQTYMEIKKLLFVDKNNFDPKPEVSSVVISLIKNNENLDLPFIKFVKLCFISKRKTLFNNLKQHYDSDKIKQTLIELNINKKARAEELTTKTFKELYNLICHDIKSI
jgi:16S rRNA (adenine1518-N6/adenine1519-N6)-dimethyltransferase